MGSYGYLIRSDDYKSSYVVKIGITNNLKKRMAQIKTGSPSSLTLYHFFKFDSRRDSRKWELKYHGIFRNKRTNGEWFVLEENDLSVIISETNIWLDQVRQEKSKNDDRKNEKTLEKLETREENKEDDGNGFIGCLIFLVIGGFVVYFLSGYMVGKNKSQNKYNNESVQKGKIFEENNGIVSGGLKKNKKK